MQREKDSVVDQVKQLQNDLQSALTTERSLKDRINDAQHNIVTLRGEKEEAVRKCESDMHATQIRFTFLLVSLLSYIVKDDEGSLRLGKE